MTDIAMPSTFQLQPRRVARPGRRSGMLCAGNYCGVLQVSTALLLVRPSLALRVMRDRRADSPIPRFRR
jgi:hypothetical protein